MGVEDLNLEVQAKAREAETIEDLEKLADECGQALSDEKLDVVSGGVLPHCKGLCPSHGKCPTATGLDGRPCTSYQFR